MKNGVESKEPRSNPPRRSGTVVALAIAMQRRSPHHRVLAVVVVAVLAPPTLLAGIPDPADHSMRQFLEQDDTQHPYRAVRRLEVENGDRRGWLQAVTSYAPDSGFSYQVTAEGGSSVIRSKVLRAVLEGERELIAQGDAARSSIDVNNYAFQPNGVDDQGLANILLAPKRQEPALVAGTMFLQPADGDLVRVQGRLAKSPSFWVKDVHIVRSYRRIRGVVVPIALESTARVRMLGPATLRMTYSYSEIDGNDVSAAQH
jgi:hypothetical protein